MKSNYKQIILQTFAHLSHGMIFIVSFLRHAEIKVEQTHDNTQHHSRETLCKILGMLRLGSLSSLSEKSKFLKNNEKSAGKRGTFENA